MAGALLVPQLAAAAGSGSFSPTGSLAGGRFGAAAATLPDGRVIVMGGTPNNATDLTTSEIFDPATGTFSATGAMNTGREFPAAAPLGDGRILVAGGLSSGSTTNTAETYDPATGTWTPTTNMGTPRRDAMAATLPDGRVLVAGGLNGTTFLQSAEIYNPGTATWTPTGNMGTTRIGAAISKLRDGRILVAGGSPSLLATTATAEIYDPAAGTWSPTGSLSGPRAFTAGALFGDGRALVVGGNPALTGPETWSQTAEMFDPVAGTFGSSGIGSMATARASLSAAALGDGRVLVVGGSTQAAPTTGLTTAEIYAATNTFTSSLQGRNLLVAVQATGNVTVSDTANPAPKSAPGGNLLAHSAKKKKKKKKRKRKPPPLSTAPPLILTASATGDPPTITVPLHLTQSAENSIALTGSVTISARITFSPQGGLPSTQTTQLTVTGPKTVTPKKHKKKHKKHKKHKK